MKKIFSVIFYFLLNCSFGQTNLEKISPFFNEIDALITDFKVKNNLPSVAYGIVLEGKLIHSQNFGEINLVSHQVSNGQSVYRIASMTKSIVAMAILQLRDAGKLKLDNPVYLYIPEIKGQKFSKDSPEITIRHLLTHAAGFPEDNPWGDRQLAISDATMLKMFKNGISFSSTPGTTYEYSNMGFAMLGYIVKKVSGQTYESYINEHIFKPLNMNNTYWDYTKVPEKQLVIGYRYLKNEQVPQPMLGNGAYGAMGGLLTTIDDFAKYMALLQSGKVSDGPEPKVLKRSSIREMQQPWNISAFNTENKNANGKAWPFVSAYGYGLRYAQDADHKIGIGHSGGLPGFGSNWKILTDFGLGVVTFANGTYAPTSNINVQILDYLVEKAGLKPKPIPVSPILKQRQNELVALLPDWNNAEKSGIFAENFFLDYFPETLAAEANSIFKKAGKLLKVNEIVAENALRGTFILECENNNIEINFTLSPEKPGLIQEYNIK